MSLGASLFVYLITFLVSIICIYLAEKKNKGRKQLYYIAVLVPSITAAFRQAGIDYFTYQEIFGWIKNGDANYLEPFWLLLNKISFSYECCLFLAAVIFYGVSCVAICRYLSRDRWIAWFIFLVITQGIFYNGMRQMLAVSIAFLGFSYLQEKKIRKYIFCIILACMFHKSTILLLLIPIYLRITKNKKNPEILIVLMCICFPLLLPLIASVLESVGLFVGYLSKTPSSSMGFLLYMLPPLFFYYTIRNRCVRDPSTRWYHGLYLLVFPFQFLGSVLAYADRYMLFFQVFLVVLVPSIIHQYDARGKKHHMRGIYFAWFVVHYVVLYILMNSNGVFPYRL